MFELPCRLPGSPSPILMRTTLIFLSLASHLICLLLDLATLEGGYLLLVALLCLAKLLPLGLFIPSAFLISNAKPIVIYGTEFNIISGPVDISASFEEKM